VANANDLAACYERIASLSHGLRQPALMAPQATIISVVGDAWQQTVLGLSARVPALLIDVGSPTANLLWELEQVAAMPPAKCVLIGDAASLKRWAVDGAEHDDDIESQTRHFLRDRDVILYDASTPDAPKILRQNLLPAFDNAIGHDASAAAGWRSRWRVSRSQVRETLQAGLLFVLTSLVAVAICLGGFKAVIWIASCSRPRREQKSRSG